MVCGRPKKETDVQVITYLEGEASSGEDSFFFHDVRKNDTDFMLVNNE